MSVFVRPRLCYMKGFLFYNIGGRISAGIATLSDDNDVFIEKGQGIARQVFSPAKMEALAGFAGIGHVRYSTSGSARALSEVQPFLCQPALWHYAGA